MGWGGGGRKQEGMTPEFLVWVNGKMRISLAKSGIHGFFMCGRGRSRNRCPSYYSLPFCHYSAWHIVDVQNTLTFHMKVEKRGKSHWLSVYICICY